MLVSLGRFAARRRFIVLAVWAVLFVAGLALSGAVFDNTADVPNAPAGSESLAVAAALDELDPEGETVVAVIEGENFFDPALMTSASDVMFGIRGMPGVVQVTDAYTGGGLASDDERSSLVVVELDRSLSQDEALELADQVRDLLHTIEPAEVLVGGELLSEQAFVDSAVIGAAIGEGAALVILTVLLVIILGGFRIGVLPVVTALLTVITALLVLSGVIEFVEVNEFAVNVITILGLGLAVDYCLLVIMRFRDERAADKAASVEELLGRTVGSAGRAVLVSGFVVCISLVGMLLLGDPLLSGMAVGGAIAVLLAALAGVTFVPAFVATIHRHVPAARARTWSRPWTRPSGRRGLLTRLASLAQRRPVAVTIASTAALLLLAAPLATLTVGSSDIQSLPVHAEERRAYEATTTRFTELGVEPVVVLVDEAIGSPEVQALFDEIATLPSVIDTGVVLDLPTDVAALEVTASGTATGSEAQALVRDIRAIDSSVPFTVGGAAAELVDTVTHLTERLPIAAGVVLVATFALLFALTGSLVIPLKTLLLNTLTIAATLGVVVVLFQWGWGASVLGFAPWGALDATTPLLIGLLAFGLSMDYAVFLLARIHENWRARDPKLDLREANNRAVLKGITDSGEVVTTAALAISIVFLGFAVGELLAMKEVGVGMLVAVILDVTIIRGLLLPATMTLLGRWNWWGPSMTRATPRRQAAS